MSVEYEASAGGCPASEGADNVEGAGIRFLNGRVAREVFNVFGLHFPAVNAEAPTLKLARNEILRGAFSPAKRRVSNEFVEESNFSIEERIYRTADRAGGYVHVAVFLRKG